MRVAAAIIMLTSTGWAQFKSTVPLVVAPTTVTDSKGRYADGLTLQDLILYDNNVPQDGLDDLSDRSSGRGPDQREFRRRDR
jgi:hypothetical protein